MNPLIICRTKYSITLFILLIQIFFHSAEAKTVRYELTVRNERVNLSGKKDVDFALTVNGGIPAPTLEFTEGDDAEILVINEIPHQELSIHWHGLLLPPEEDGVAYINTPPIHPKNSRLFKFKIRQNGTYWYHSHTGLQEQKGVYGAIIIHPKRKQLSYDRDLVLVLSDWSDENADQILRNLRKDGDYYLYKKNTIRSYWGAIQSGGFTGLIKNEWNRMGGMDLSDVAYDAFLINGKQTSQIKDVRPGEKVRLRVINAGASSYFYASMGVPLTVISADGIDVQATQAKTVLIGMAETYDFLFTVPEKKSYEFRATVQDVTGYASIWIGEGERVYAPDQAYPDLYSSMDHHDHSAGKAKSSHSSETVPSGHAEHMGHGHHPALPSQEHALLTVDHLRALKTTSFSPKAKVHELQLTLGGDMERYIWHINGKAIHQDRILHIQEGELVRFKFVNETMMHHPMHLHGHFFRVINSNGERSPLKHTVDVSPHSSRTIEFLAEEPGQWMLHCHNLYHMKTGMARVIRYRDYKLTPEMLINEFKDPHLHDHLYYSGSLEVASNHAITRLKLMRTWDEVDFRFETAEVEGRNFTLGERWENEGDLNYRRWTSNFYNLFGGASIYDEKTYGVLGIGAVLPLLIEAQISLTHSLKPRLDIERRFQWTSVLFTDFDLSWRPRWGGERDLEFEANFMYGPQWHWAAGLMFTEKSVGVGAQFQF